MLLCSRTFLGTLLGTLIHCFQQIICVLVHGVLIKDIAVRLFALALQETCLRKKLRYEEKFHVVTGDIALTIRGLLDIFPEFVEIVTLGEILTYRA